ncbi:hypothetical protein TH66_04490 [Carbonactinospora thermoautotrophica]|uniref:Rhamnogalacturonides degradation protein RhiN n=1 Tax=Carbonactinospora thermoautotrophica TaxID=1469144 RepID=A0A132N4E7_9ACTN|nr:glycoside hydrolase family 88 protein [Carbonactinospora thermoautotrophica]KWW99203.1 Rhamnogalacturonides degradation protein RhiN [Carbonactinospora thermoautotrophica]KWX05021.1 hypothetical protein TH66_04490 [Carbonactinospora thermoautotrophica]KWX08405.1 hypothetical protein TR74_15160 [Carbonactinospora thermoautotrophica]
MGTPADELRQTLRRLVRRTQEMGLEPWLWGEGVALLGLMHAADALGDPEPLRFVRGWADRHLCAGYHVEHVNNVIPGAALVLLHEQTGEPRYLEEAEKLADWVMHTAERAPNGALFHWPDGVWVDTVFMAGALLSRLGARTGRIDMVDEAGRQLLTHAEILRDPGTGLFAHGSHMGRTLPCYWGRGNAWMALACVEFLEACSAAHTMAGTVRWLLESQAAALVALQPPDGIWPVLVDGAVARPETSGAAGIAAAWLRAWRNGWLDDSVHDAAWRVIEALARYIAADGALTRVSAGTVLQLIPDGYAVIRDDEIQPWGQGLAMMAYAAALEAAA